MSFSSKVSQGNFSPRKLSETSDRDDEELKGSHKGRKVSLAKQTTTSHLAAGEDEEFFQSKSYTDSSHRRDTATGLPSTAASSTISLSEAARENNGEALQAAADELHGQVEISEDLSREEKDAAHEKIKKSKGFFAKNWKKIIGFAVLIGGTILAVACISIPGAGPMIAVLIFSVTTIVGVLLIMDSIDDDYKNTDDVKESKAEKESNATQTEDGDETQKPSSKTGVGTEHPTDRRSASVGTDDDAGSRGTDDKGTSTKSKSISSKGNSPGTNVGTSTTDFPENSTNDTSTQTETDPYANKLTQQKMPSVNIPGTVRKHDQSQTDDEKLKTLFVPINDEHMTDPNEAAIHIFSSLANGTTQPREIILKDSPEETLEQIEPSFHNRRSVRTNTSVSSYLQSDLPSPRNRSVQTPRDENLSSGMFKSTSFLKPKSRDSISQTQRKNVGTDFDSTYLKPRSFESNEKKTFANKKTDTDLSEYDTDDDFVNPLNTRGQKLDKATKTSRNRFEKSSGLVNRTTETNRLSMSSTRSEEVQNSELVSRLRTLSACLDKVSQDKGNSRNLPNLNDTDSFLDAGKIARAKDTLEEMVTFPIDNIKFLPKLNIKIKYASNSFDRQVDFKMSFKMASGDFSNLSELDLSNDEKKLITESYLGLAKFIYLQNLVSYYIQRSNNDGKLPSVEEANSNIKDKVKTEFNKRINRLHETFQLPMAVNNISFTMT